MKPKLLFFTLAVCCATATLTAHAQVPGIINYQGRVVVVGTNFDGTGQFKFALVNNTGAATYWSNGNAIVSVTVTKGLYSVLLGDTGIPNMMTTIPAAVFTNTDVRLRVWFDGGAGLQQLSPDQRLTAVGYALMAASVPDGAITSNKLANGAVTSAVIANGAVGASQLANFAITAANIATGGLTGVSIASNTITTANIAAGAGLVPSTAIVLSQTATNAALSAAGFSLLATTNPPPTWTLATNAASWSARDSIEAINYNGRMWALGGKLVLVSSLLNEVWSSANGVDWTLATNSAAWAARFGHTALSYDGKMWVLGGETGFNQQQHDVWSSTNGVNWTQVTSAAPWARRNHRSVVYDGKMWVLGGLNFIGRLNDVWSSTNGLDWVQATNAAPWIARANHEAVAYGDKMWVLGGSANGNPGLNDVWSSTNGVNWTQETNAASWTGRYNPVCMVLDGQMWLMGGLTPISFTNDVWSSTDGANWTLSTNAAPWIPRQSIGSVVFSNRMWLLGGYTGNSITDTNDVWSRGQSTTTPNTLGSYYLYQKQ